MSANSAGAIFLRKLWDRIQTDPKARKDLLGLDNSSDIALIDSKDTSNSYNLNRETYYNSFLNENEFMTGIRCSSSVRGDLLDLKNRLLIFDFA